MNYLKKIKVLLYRNSLLNELRLEVKHPIRGSINRMKLATKHQVTTYHS